MKMIYIILCRLTHRWIHLHYAQETGHIVNVPEVQYLLHGVEHFVI